MGQKPFDIRVSGSRFMRMIYRKVASSNMSGLEAHAGLLRLLMEGVFNPHVL